MKKLYALTLAIGSFAASVQAGTVNPNTPMKDLKGATISIFGGGTQGNHGVTLDADARFTFGSDCTVQFAKEFANQRIVFAYPSKRQLEVSDVKIEKQGSRGIDERFVTKLVVKDLGATINGKKANHLSETLIESIECRHPYSSRSSYLKTVLEEAGASAVNIEHPDVKEPLQVRDEDSLKDVSGHV